MEEVRIVNHLHKLIEDLQRLQQHSYPHALNNIAEQTRFQEFINLTMTMVNIEIKVRQSRIVDNYLIRHTPLGEVPPIPPITQIDSGNGATSVYVRTE
jgi:hypothetical protein